MVKSTGKAAGAGPIRPLNLPASVEVEEDGLGRPAALVVGRRRLRVAFVEDRWEIADEWWRPKPVARVYYRVCTEDGGRATLFRDLAGGGWYTQRG